jgi:exopolyphosphatase/guanosine-5'-triphosphate,3'-diphosphate pyrophosphatase
LGEGDISVELFGGKVKGDLFEIAFRKKLLLIPLQQESPIMKG